MSKYKIHISAGKLAEILGLPAGTGIPLRGGYNMPAIEDVASWIDGRIYEGLIPEIITAGELHWMDYEGRKALIKSAVNMHWDQDGISILTDELDSVSILRLRKRLVRATCDAIVEHSPDAVAMRFLSEGRLSLDDIQVIAI